MCARDIPVFLQSTTTTNFAEAINQLTGLTHLANKQVSVFADNQEVAAPGNSDFTILIVGSDGTLTLPDYYNWGYVGLPYEMYLETLNLETADARTFTEYGKLINAVGIGISKTGGGSAGQPGQGIFEPLNLMTIGDITTKNNLFTGYIEVPFQATWEMTGRIAIKQVEPLPMSILAIYPKGVTGG
jgi:hypothetical protein